MQIREFQHIADHVMASLPATFQTAMVNVVICVEDEPDVRTLAAMQVDSSNGLLGLYQGWPLSERGISYAGHLPDMIYLYRKPIVQYCDETGEKIEDCIRHVLVHEIGHYFGFSDQEMEAIECPKP